MSRKRVGNVVFVCDDDAPKPDPQYAELSPEHFLGGSVKIAFHAIDPTGQKNLEHMWVRVNSVENGLLVGTLDNDPIYECGVSYGSTVHVPLDKIEAFLPAKQMN